MIVIAFDFKKPWNNPCVIIRGFITNNDSIIEVVNTGTLTYCINNQSNDESRNMNKLLSE